MNALRSALVARGLKVNVVAGVIGSGWSALMQLAFIPVYVRFMGIEAYGLIGFYVTLQAVLQVLDFGLSPTMSREMARYSALPGQAGEARDFVRTVEVGYWALGLAIGGLLALAAPTIAAHWIKTTALPQQTTQRALMLMGALTALQWPLSLYVGGLMGLQRQVLANALQIGLSTLASGGAAAVLWLVSPSILTFLMWQVGVAALRVAVVTAAFWHSLPPADRAPRMDVALVRATMRFAAGMSGLTLTTLIFTQLDKVILSKLLTLSLFGYYMLATVIGNGLYTIITPFFGALFPRFTELATNGDTQTLRAVYHRAAQFMTVLIVPVAVIVALFSFEIVQVWTGSADTALKTAPIVRFLVLGTALNGLMNVPYALQLSYGWTDLGLKINLFFLLALVPGIVFMASHFGAVGAASVWLALNAIYVGIGVPLTHRRLLKGEAALWFGRDVGLPLVASVLAALAARVLIPGGLSRIGAGISLTNALLAAWLLAALAAPQVRRWGVAEVRRALLSSA